MKISIIVAKSENNVIGVNNDLPWKLAEDLNHFKKQTLNRHILMGRKTFDSIGRPLPKRTSLVLSRDPKPSEGNVYWFSSLTKAIGFATDALEEELFVIGGEAIFEETLHIADCIYLTEVSATLEGDTFFPELNMKEWEVTSEQKYYKSDVNDHDFTIKLLTRII